MVRGLGSSLFLQGRKGSQCHFLRVSLRAGGSLLEAGKLRCDGSEWRRRRQRCRAQANLTSGLILSLLTEKDRGLGAQDTKRTSLAVDRLVESSGLGRGVTGGEAGATPVSKGWGAH